MSRKSIPNATVIKLARLVAALLVLTTPPAWGAETHEEFNIEGERVEKENILNLIFGSAPKMATERGILIIDAFFDRNGNGEKDRSEETLDREIVCQMDDIEYTVPAFIPGLAYDGSYQILCAGNRFRPTAGSNNIFIKQRGQVIKLNLPCEEASPKAALLQRNPS